SCRAHGIDQSAARQLRRQTDESAGGEDKSDVQLRPMLRSQIDGDERSEASLNVRKKEGEPIEPTGARRRRGAGRHRRVKRDRAPRKETVCAGAKPITLFQ